MINVMLYIYFTTLKQTNKTRIPKGYPHPCRSFPGVSSLDCRISPPLPLTTFPFLDRLYTVRCRLKLLLAEVGSNKSGNQS